MSPLNGWWHGWGVVSRNFVSLVHKADRQRYLMPVFAAEGDIGSWSYGFGEGLSVDDSDGNASYRCEREMGVDIASDGEVYQAVLGSCR